MNETESVDETPANAIAGHRPLPQYQSDEEYILGHISSVPEERVVVQAEVIMAYLLIL